MSICQLEGTMILGPLENCEGSKIQVLEKMLLKVLV